MAGTELSTAPFFFSMLVEFRSSKDSHCPIAMAQGNCRTTIKPLLVFSSNRKYDGDRLVYGTLADDTAEVLAL